MNDWDKAYMEMKSHRNADPEPTDKAADRVWLIATTITIGVSLGFIGVWLLELL